MLKINGLIFVGLLSSFSLQAEIPGQYIESSDLTVGTDHACAITTAGVKCFGYAEAWTLKVPSDLKNVSKLQSGNRFNCALTDKGIRCWGEITGQSRRDILISNRSFKNPKLLAVGYDHACAVSASDQIKCWGKNEQGEGTPPVGLRNISEMSLGMTNSCVIADKKVVCWGISSTGSTNVPDNLINPRNLTSGWWHHCVQTDDGYKCWGYPFKQPTTPDDSTIRSVTSGGPFNCGLSDTGVKCWNESGKTSLLPDSETTKILKVGSTYVCGITDLHGVACWRFEKNGEREGVFKRLRSFVPAGGLVNIERISAGNTSTCIYGDADEVKCWGRNPDGVLDIPAQIEGPVSTFSLGLKRLCTVTKNGVNCYGNGRTDFDVPKNLGETILVSSGGYQICASNKDKITCWGDDVRDALTVPKNLTNITQLSSGFTHVCAVADGAVNCWGGSGLIKGVNPDKKLINPRAICAGGTFSCAIDDLGKVNCWGKQIPFAKELSKELSGVNTMAVLSVPPQIDQAVELACGLSHACAIYKGKVKCWGDSGFTGTKLSPSAVKNPRMLTAGWNHSCVLGDAGPSCWGEMTNLDMPNYSLEK